MNQPSTEQAIEAVTRQGQDQTPDTPKDEPKRRKRWLLKLVLVVLVLLIALIGFAPMLLSTSSGTAWVVSMINNRVDGELTINSLSLNWGAGQSVQQLRYVDSDKGIELHIGSVHAKDVSLFGLITGDMKLGQVEINAADLIYTATEQADVPQKQEAAKQAEDKPFALPPGLSGSLVLTNMSVHYVAKEQDSALLMLPSGSIDMPDLRDISVNLDATLQQGLSEGSIQLNGSVLNLFDPDGVSQLAKASYKLDAKVDGVSTNVLDSLAGGMGTEPGLVKELLGEGALEASAKANGTLDQLAAELKVNTPNLFIELFQEREGNTLIASPRSSAKLTLTTKAFAKLFKDSSLVLLNDEQVVMESLQFKLPTNDDGIDLQASSVVVRLKAEDSIVMEDAKGEVVVIDDLLIRGGSGAIAEQVAIEFSAGLSSVSKDSQTATREPFKAELLVKQPLDKKQLEIVFFSERLPIRLADALLGQDEKLVMWLGEGLALRVDVAGQGVPDEQAEDGQRWVRRYTLLPEGRVDGELVGELDGNRYTLGTKEKTRVTAELIPEAFASLMEKLSGVQGKPLLTIDKAMPVFVSLRDEERGDITIVTDPTKKGAKRFYPDPDQTYLGATIELSPTRVYDPAQDKTYELRGGTLSVSAPDLRGEAKVKADLRLWVRPDAGSEGIPALLSWQTTVADILDTDGAVPLDGALLMQQIVMNGGVKLENAPSGLFDSLLNKDGDISSILGPIVQDLEAAFAYSDGRPTGAQVKLNWDDKNNQPIAGAWASMNPVAFEIDENQIMTVRGGTDIELNVTVAQAFGDRWMGQLHPILFDAKSGDRPVRIKIDGKSFRFPLNDKTGKMKGANVQAEVDLGSIAFGDDALLGRIMEWTGRPGERAVFSPAKVALVDGKISYDRFDMTVGNVQLRLDGKVDLATGKIDRMAVRVPGRSLTKVFNDLEGIVAPDDYLSIPMTGSIRKPQFDRGLIAREVARLAARGLIEKQKDKLRDKLFKDVFDGLGLPNRPEPEQPAQPGKDKPEDPKPEDKPKPVEDQIRDELIDRGLDLIFGGGKREQDKKKDD